jgi:L-ribulokinase
VPESHPARSDSAAIVVGVDFGTLSGRAVVVRVADGEILGEGVHPYRHGVMERRLAATDQALPPDWALQVPADYLEVLRVAVPKALAAAGVAAADVIGIGTDFTASTVLPTLVDGTPLCELDDLADRPHAYVKLWKHHAAQAQADRITALARDDGAGWLGRYGGRISSEWQFAKALQVLEEDPLVYARTAHWVEASDWITWRMTGRYVRNATANGYKALYQDGSYPPRDFLASLNPGFADFARDKLAGDVAAQGRVAGGLSDEAAAWTTLPAGTPVCVGNVDAHVTAAAVGGLGRGEMLAIMGTSTCHILNSDELATVPGICGVVWSGIATGQWGYEAGQSGVGDLFGWVADHCISAECVAEAAASEVSMHDLLTRKAAQQPAGAHGLLALDWHNGNRSVLVDHGLTGLLIGLTLATRPEDIYRALMEATAFGTRIIIETFVSAGVEVTKLVIAGGLVKNELLMQIYADIIRVPVCVVDCEHAPALGAAIYAAVAAGAYPDAQSAATAMGQRERTVYTPRSHEREIYDRLYAEYRILHDWFGNGGSDVMHRLRDIRLAASA